MDSVGYIDQSGLYALEDVLLYLEQHNIHVLLVAPQEQPIVMLESTQLIPALIPEAQIFEDIKSCLEHLKELHIAPKVSDVS
jgi:SulP family sulfate permease